MDTWGTSKVGSDSMFKGPEAEACLVLQGTAQRPACLEGRDKRTAVGGGTKGPGGHCRDHSFYLGRQEEALEGLVRGAHIWNSGDLGSKSQFCS